MAFKRLLQSFHEIAKDDNESLINSQISRKKINNGFFFHLLNKN